MVVNSAQLAPFPSDLLNHGQIDGVFMAKVNFKAASAL